LSTGFCNPAENRCKFNLLDNLLIYDSLVAGKLLPDAGTHLLPEDRLGLTSETLLLPVVTTPALSTLALLGLLVLRHLVQLVDLALLAESATLFWYVHLQAGNGNQLEPYFLEQRTATHLEHGAPHIPFYETAMLRFPLSISAMFSAGVRRVRRSLTILKR